MSYLHYLCLLVDSDAFFVLFRPLSCMPNVAILLDCSFFSLSLRFSLTIGTSI